MKQQENTEEIIRHTKKWINDVVIGCNFCPFAAKVINERKVHFRIIDSEILSTSLEGFLEECVRLDQQPQIETTLIILTHSFQQFDHYLKLIALVEKLLRKHGYEGVYQVASFHPDYCFAGEAPNDASNYTNRSPYPMLHLLRETSIEKAVNQHPDIHQIPINNIKFARDKGELYMKMLLSSCFS